MPTTYQECGDVMDALARRVMRDYYHVLLDADVKLGYLFAANPDGAAIKSRGYPAAAQVRIVNLKDRVAGMPDAMVIVDEERWKGLADTEKLALLHHELYHLIPVENSDKARDDGAGKWKLDDCGRPKLKMRRHDFELGVFYDVIERHQESALDLQVIVKINQELRERNLVQQKMWG